MSKLWKQYGMQLKPTQRCNPDEVSLKTFFLGPQAENSQWLLEMITQMFDHWFNWRKNLFPQDGGAISSGDQKTPEFLHKRRLFEEALTQVNKAFEDEMPSFSPRYIGHMYSEISLPALLGHLVTLLHNPNNISSESSRVGVKLENEAIHALSKMVGYDPQRARGHFTSGGTLANFEAITRANRRIKTWLSAESSSNRSVFEAAHGGWELFSESSKENRPSLQKGMGPSYLGPVILVSESRHYSWDKGLNLVGLGEDALWGVELDKWGRMSLPDLENKIEKASKDNRPILMITSVAGTTELGCIDEIQGINNIIETWKKRGLHFWHHVDAAYGGFFKTLSPEIGFKSLEGLREANSITLDPHKLAYVPYASGTFLCRDPLEYYLNSTSAPYINFKHGEDRGPVTLEGSRSAGGAVATWLTSKCVGFNSEGYGRILKRTIQSASRLEGLLKEKNPRIKVLPSRDTNIICFCVAQDKEQISKTNFRTLKIFEEFSPSKNSKFIVSKTSLSWKKYKNLLDYFTGQWKAQINDEMLHVIRLCLMNPFHDSQELHCDMSQEFVAHLSEIISKEIKGSEIFAEK